MLKYSVKQHANELREHAADLMRMANCLENIGDHVQKLSEPEAP